MAADYPDLKVRFKMLTMRNDVGNAHLKRRRACIGEQDFHFVCRTGIESRQYFFQKQSDGMVHGMALAMVVFGPHDALRMGRPPIRNPLREIFRIKDYLITNAGCVQVVRVILKQRAAFFEREFILKRASACLELSSCVIVHEERSACRPRSAIRPLN